MDFTWDPAGLIDVVAQFVAIPDVTLTLSSNSIDQTILAAFVLLVLLTAVQSGLLVYSVLLGVKDFTSIWKIMQASNPYTNIHILLRLCPLGSWRNTCPFLLRMCSSTPLA